MVKVAGAVQGGFLAPFLGLSLPICYYPKSERGVAQWLARMVWDHEVGGSNPPTPTRDRENEAQTSWCFRGRVPTCMTG